MRRPGDPEPEEVSIRDGELERDPFGGAVEWRLVGHS
jgi:hypothetical protein